MIQDPTPYRQYRTAYERYLKPAIENFFKREFSGYFGPLVRENIADALIEIFNQNAPESSCLKHGQILWNALDKDTKASSENVRYRPVVLSLVTEEDLREWQKPTAVPLMRKRIIARIIKEAYQQGGILSMRDIGLILCIDDSMASTGRIAYEKENQVVLPHVGSLHDMGTTLTHKREIVYKHIRQKKSTPAIARETNHSQKAVDRYIKDFYRVKTLTLQGKDIDFIHLITQLSKQVILQYQDIINQYVKEH